MLVLLLIISMLSREEVAARIMQLPAENQAVAARAALELYGPAEKVNADEFAATRFDPARYIADRLGWSPWSGNDEQPGQQQAVDAYVLALRQQHEREAYQQGEIAECDLQYWRPGEVIKNRIRIEAGHTVGKTKLASGIVSHFFDHFAPAIIYTFAPTWEQVKRLLWKEIQSDREGKGLPGRVMDTCEIKYRPDHFAMGRATSDAGGRGTERVHGQHGRYLMFVIDEAEGAADFVFDAIDSMTSGGISIVLMLANPRTRTSRFHKQASYSNVQNFRISCLYHPNVLSDREIVPGAVKRQYVLDMLEKHCTQVDQHDPDNHTFSLPWEPAVIYRPDAEFMFRVLGIAPANVSDKNLVTVGRYEAATKRQPQSDRPMVARIGIDCARWGRDMGTIYVRHDGAAWRAARLAQADNIAYYLKAKAIALELKGRDVTSLHFRVDAGGGFGGGVVDLLLSDDELLKAFADYQVIEVNFGGAPQDENAYYDWITEATADVAETLKSLAILNAPANLESDLCEREWQPRNKAGRFVRKLEEKEKFRKREKRSPDDGDGFTLAVVSDFLVSADSLAGLFDAGSGVMGWSPQT